MKHFNIECWEGELSDTEIEKRQHDYAIEVAQLRQANPQLPDALFTTNLHDGIPWRATFDHATSTLALDVRAGDLQVGYFDLRLEYDGTVFTQAFRIQVQTLLGEPLHEIMVDEIGSKPAAFVHRLLCMPHF